MYPFPHYGDFTAFTPVVPELYWNVYSAEERIKALCLEWVKLVAFTDAMVDTVNEQYEEITDNIQARYDALDAAVKNIQDIVDDMQTRLPQLVNDDVVAEIRRLITSGEFNDMLQAAIDEYWTQYGARLAAAEQSITDINEYNRLNRTWEMSVAPKLPDFTLSEATLPVTDVQSCAYDSSSDKLIVCFNSNPLKVCTIDNFSTAIKGNTPLAFSSTHEFSGISTHSNACSIANGKLYVFDWNARFIDVIDLSTWTPVSRMALGGLIRSGAAIPSGIGVVYENYAAQTATMALWQTPDSMQNAIGIKFPLANQSEWVQDATFYGTNCYIRLCSASHGSASGTVPYSRSYIEVYQLGVYAPPIRVPVTPNFSIYESEGITFVGDRLVIVRHNQIYYSDDFVRNCIPQTVKGYTPTDILNIAYANMYELTMPMSNSQYVLNFTESNNVYSINIPTALARAIRNNGIEENARLIVLIPRYNTPDSTSQRWGGTITIDLKTQFNGRLNRHNANFTSFVVADKSTLTHYWNFYMDNNGLITATFEGIIKETVDGTRSFISASDVVWDTKTDGGIKFRLCR